MSHPRSPSLGAARRRAPACRDPRACPAARRRVAPRLRGPARGQPGPASPLLLHEPPYVGTCEVEPAKEETCASILEYLNNPLSQGKSYCGNTSVRGGWKSEPCEPKMKQD